VRSAGVPKASPGADGHTRGTPEDPDSPGAVTGGPAEPLDSQSIPWVQDT